MSKRLLWQCDEAMHVSDSGSKIGQKSQFFVDQPLDYQNKYRKIRTTFFPLLIEYLKTEIPQFLVLKSHPPAARTKIRQRFDA